MKRQAHGGTMQQPDYSPIPTSALIMLAQRILLRADITSLPNTNRDEAIRIIRGVRPAPRRTEPHGIKARAPKCPVCHEALLAGSLCDAYGSVHIECAA